MRILTGAFVTFFALPILALPALAQADAPKLQGTFGDWQTYTRFDGAEQICYVLTKAESKSPSSVRHGEIYFMVANWKNGAASEQPSFLAGYELMVTNPPTARVGNQRYRMYADQNEGFIEEASQEQELVQAMREGSDMRIDAMSKRGTNVSYTFSLKGVTAALKRAKDSCS